MRAIRTMLLVAVVALLAASCSSGGGDDGGVASIDDVSTETTATAAPTSDGSEPAIDEEKVLEFAACMREQGIDFPDPVVDADGNVGFDLMALRELTDVDEDELRAAFEPCADLLAGVNFGFDQVFDAEFQDDLVAFSECMRANGFDMPDPDFTGLAEGEPLYPQLNLDDPDFETAFDVCRDTLPGIPGIAG